MGLTGFARKYLRQKYAQAFSFKKPGMPHVIIYDLMKDVKYLPPKVDTLRGILKYLVDRVKEHFFVDGVETCIVLVDRKPLDVKRAITHKKRYETNNRVNRLDENNGPYLPQSLDEKLNLGGTNRPWIDFACNYKNLQRELYPLLLNAFLTDEYIVPRPYQKLYLHGFPGFVEYQYVDPRFAHTLRTDGRGKSEVVHLWQAQYELPLTEKGENDDPNLYNRVFFKEHIPPCFEYKQGLMRIEEDLKMTNDISEADAAMFFYDHFFQDKNIMFVCNDGDVFSYGLLYSMERVTAQNVFRNIHYGCLPYKLEEQEDDIFPNGLKPPYEYIDFNMFYIMVKEDYGMQMAGVQNHVATLVFMLILAGSDYFKDYAKNIGKDTIVWSVFMFNLSMFSHMVQLSKGFDPDTRTPRTFVIDEDCFRLFIHYCYAEKYGMSIRKNTKKEIITYEDIKAHTKNLKQARDGDEEYFLPSRNKIRLWCRQIDYNLHLYKNAHISAPDPYRLFNGVPYYPYSKTEGVIKAVSVKRPPVDEVYRQHFISNKREKFPDISEQKKRKIVEALAGGTAGVPGSRTK